MISMWGQRLSHWSQSYIPPKISMGPARIMKTPMIIPQVAELLYPKQ